MSRIVAAFDRLRQRGRKALIGYITVGYPTIEATVGTARILVEAGCDLIELGIPFSDPLADGATIQRASFRALANGVTTKVCLETAARLRQYMDVPLVFMTYYNPILRYGLSAFCERSQAVGVDGLIVPDLPPDEGQELEESARRAGLDVIYLAAPTSTEERIRKVAAHSTGFIYLVSLTGVTGARETLPAEIEDFVARVREICWQPLCIGFGISSAEQAQRIARIADGVIVGSKLINLLEEGDTQRLQEFVRALRRALDA